MARVASSSYPALRLRLLRRGAVLLLVAVTAAGCRSGEADRSEVALDPVLGDLPNDLAIDVTILPGRAVGAYSEAHRTRSKYILFPDGSLHGDEGRSIGVLTRPALVRVLTREEMTDVWVVAEETGFANLASADFDGNPALLAPRPDELLTTISVTAEGRTRTFVRRAAPLEVDPATRRMVRTLAALAFASDDPPAESLVMPLRYDLGPDPYRRFLPPAPVRAAPP